MALAVDHDVIELHAMRALRSFGVFGAFSIQSMRAAGVGK